jgi:GTP-binding protein HflX
MRALSGADAYTEDLLFATLDPLTRRVRLPGGGFVLLTDTVGFIQKLPTGLVAAFRATLEELADADLLLHVVDITHPQADAQWQTVEATLGDLDLGKTPRLLLLNKVDLLLREGVGDTAQAELRRRYPEALLISAERRWGLDRVLEEVQSALEARLPVAAAP